MHWDFIIATALITLMPGPSMLIIMMTAIERGLWRSVLAITGVVLADAILLVLVLSGLGALLYTSALAFTVLKWLGAGYLLYLGWMQLRNAREAALNAATSGSNAFLQGLGTTLLNPKIIGFLIVYFPQFLHHDEAVATQMWRLGPIFLLVVFAVFLACAVGARGLRHLLETQRGRTLLARAAGVSLMSCGVYSALST
jgi:threonine/homoserine/homoserine lactone efflux protein